jgi:hypothetical protein
MANKKNVKGLDLGASHIVMARHGEEDGYEFKQELNAFVEIPFSRITVNMLKKKGIPHRLDGDVCFAFGNGAEQFANMTGGDTRRPMYSGLLNPNEPKSLEMTEEALTKVCGKAAQGEKICFSVPSASPQSESDLTFHERTVTQMLEGLGYKVKSLNEGLAVVYADLEEDSFTGIGISFGGGMCNVCVAYLGMPALSFCTVQAGDYIDRSTASVTNETTTTVRLYKEKGFSINGLSQNNLDQALSVYYGNMIRGITEGLEKEVASSKKLPRFEEPIPVVISGGSALAGGFHGELAKAFKDISLPFEISQVKMAEDPFNSTAKGTLLAATLEM